MRKILFKTFFVIFGLYIATLTLLYFSQEKMMFKPEKLDKNYAFKFEEPYNLTFEEFNIKSTDGINLNGLLFKAENPKGLIFYLHGNGGSLRSFGEKGKTYVDLGYDVFILDYRGYGKSEGKIYENEEQLYQDNQIVYDLLKKQYKEEEIIIIGNSLGTGFASKLASENNPKQLILLAPYYNFPDVAQSTYWFVPQFLVKYKFYTNKYLKNVKMPVAIFHGDKDDLIYHGSSLKLKKYFKPGDRLFTLKDEGHSKIENTKGFKNEIERILAK
jgi:pimeloyl-ACP methyl ester carboxylesterase